MGTTGPALAPSGLSNRSITMASTGKISPKSAIEGLLSRDSRLVGRATGPADTSERAYLSMAAANTSFASAWVGTPKPGTSMPMIRTPLIDFGKRSNGTPEAVGTQRLITTTASYLAGSARVWTDSLISSKSLPVTRDSESKGTYPTVRRAP